MEMKKINTLQRKTIHKKICSRRENHLSLRTNTKWVVFLLFTAIILSGCTPELEFFRYAPETATSTLFPCEISHWVLALQYGGTSSPIPGPGDDIILSAKKSDGSTIASCVLEYDYTSEVSGNKAAYFGCYMQIPDAGPVTVEASYPGNSEFDATTYSTTYTAKNKLPSEIIIDDVQSWFNQLANVNQVSITGRVVQSDTGICPGWEAPDAYQMDATVAGSNYFIDINVNGEFTLGAVVPMTAGVYPYMIQYPGNQSYGPAEISGTVGAAVCDERHTEITFDVMDTALAAAAFPVGITIEGLIYDPDDCSRMDLSDGSLTLTTDEGTECQVEFTNGEGSCDSLVINTSGTHTITASYDGGGIFEDAVVTTEILVEKISSATQIVFHYPDPVQVGHSLEVSVEVSGPGPTPTGEVLVSAGGGDCTVQLVEGEGSCTLTPVIEGQTTITADYEGDETYNPSSTTSDTLVGPAKQTTVTNFTSTTEYWENCQDPYPAPVSVRVTGIGGTPTGTVSITGADTNCTITLSGGIGSCTVYFNDDYQDDTPLYATYHGDANFLGSQGSIVIDACQ
jgi:hypothetical protein